jgi:hypothetical protein
MIIIDSTCSVYQPGDYLIIILNFLIMYHNYIFIEWYHYIIDMPCHGMQPIVTYIQPVGTAFLSIYIYYSYY